MQDITFNVSFTYVKFSLLFFFGFLDEGNVVQVSFGFYFCGFLKIM